MRYMAARNLQPHAALDVPSDEQHLQSLQGPFPESRFGPPSEEFAMVLPALPPPSRMGDATLEDRLLAEVALPSAGARRSESELRSMFSDARDLHMMIPWTAALTFQEWERAPQAKRRARHASNQEAPKERAFLAASFPSALFLLLSGLRTSACGLTLLR